MLTSSVCIYSPSHLNYDSEHCLPASGSDVAQSRKLIRKDLDTMQVLVDTKEFLQYLLPLPTGSAECLSSLLDTLRQDGLYENSKWVGLPGGGVSVSESTMYGPLADLFEAINRRAHETNDGGQNREDRLNGEWFNSHASAPQLSGTHSKSRKPDIVFTSLANVAAMASSLADDHDHPRDGEKVIESVCSQNCQPYS